MKYLKKRKMSSYVRVPSDEDMQHFGGYPMPKVTFDEVGNVITTFENSHGNIIRVVESPDGVIREIKSISPKSWGNTSGT